LIGDQQLAHHVSTFLVAADVSVLMILQFLNATASADQRWGSMMYVILSSDERVLLNKKLARSA
jgi:hypothetical protein